MIRVVFIEDRLLMLRAMQSSVDWHSMGIEPIGAFASCDEALPFILSEKPNVIVTDIIMHGMNGLELSRLLHEEQPDIKVIIVSAYGRFEYAQQALQAQVYDFLEKPIDYEKLAQSILQAGKSNLQDRLMRDFIINHRELYKERMLTRLLRGSYGNEDLAYDAELVGMDAVCSAIVVNCHVKRSGATTSAHLLDSDVAGLQLCQFLTEVFDCGQVEGPCTLSSEENTFILLNLPPDDYENVLSRVSSAIVRFSEESSAVVHAGISSSVSSLRELKGAYEDATLAMDACFISEGTMVMPAQVLKQDDSLTWRRLGSLEENVIRAINMQDIVAVDKTIMEFRQGIGDTFLPGDTVKTAVKGMLYKAESQHTRDPAILAETLARIDDVDTLDEVLDIILQHCTTLVHSVRQRHSQHIHILLDAARTDIQEHFAEEGYGLNELAAHMNLSPSYLSALYKKEFGQGIYEAIMANRIERAKLLLIHTNKSIGDVGTEVGYPNPGHFSTNFRKHTGCSPTEYRNKNRD